MGSLITIFIVAIGDDWNYVMYDHYRAILKQSKVQAYICIGFFFIMFIILNMLLLNLFLAILLETYGKTDEDEMCDEFDAGEDEEDIGPLYIWLHMTKYSI